jgi:hypothetical protein
MSDFNDFEKYRRIPMDQLPKLLHIDEVLKLPEKIDINLQILIRNRLNNEVLVGSLYKNINLSEISRIRDFYYNKFQEFSW